MAIPTSRMAVEAKWLLSRPNSGNRLATQGTPYCVSMRATSQGVPFAVLARTRLIHTKWTNLAPVQWWSP